ncbi:MAG: PAS domain S-box protein [Trichloromonadaceae bacterium]
MTEETIRILLVQNSEFFAAQLRSALESGPQQVKLTVVQSLAQARKCLSEALCDLALIDQDLPDGKGQELLPGDQAAAEYPALILGNCEDVRAAVAALKAGAWDYLVKSEGLLSELPEIIARALEDWQRTLERRRTEAALQESEEQFRSFFESAASGMAIISPEGRPLRVNPTFYRLSGYTEDEALQKNVLEVTHPDDREETRRLYGEIATGRRRVIDQEKRYLKKDGAVIWGHATVAGVFGPDGALKCFSANVQDITERKAAREALRFSEERFRTVFNNAAAGMVTLAPDGRFLEVNQAFCNFTGYSREELLSLRVREITHHDDLEQTAHNYRLLVDGQGRVIDYQKRYLRKDGAIVWGHVSVALVQDGAGQPLYYIGLVQDVTESRRVQDQIRESQQMLRLVLDYIPQAVFWKDRNLVYLGCNRNFARVAGVENSQALIGKSDYDLAWKREEADFYRECDHRVMESDRPELHIIESQLQAGGKQAWLDTNKIPLHDAEGRVVGILGTFDDITERKAAEEALVKANRELDAFVYTVSHDLRSPLTPIIGYAEVLQLTCREQLDEQSLNFLAEIENQGRRMQALLEDLLVLAMVGEVERPALPVDLTAELGEVLLGLGSQMAEAGVTAKQHPLPTVRLPRSFLTQIFINLIGNAIRYAGTASSPIEIGGERVGALVQLYVRDHGPGIPPAERSRVFEVFYRGSSGHHLPGSGVGLATVLKIARLYGGRAWVEETPGGGCTFRVEVQDDAQP